MKLRTIVGFGIGYVLGARSQAEGTDDPQDLVKAVTQSDAFKTALEQARQLAATGMEALTGQEPSWAPPSGNGSNSSGEESSGESDSGGGSDQSSTEESGSETSSSGSS